MIEQYFSRTPVIAQLRLGLRGPHLDDLATTLHQQGYAPNTIRRALRAGAQFGQWLSQQSYALDEVDQAVIERYLNSLRRSPSGKLPQAGSGLPHLLRLLQQRDLLSSPVPMPSATALDDWLKRYAQYLDDVRGAAVSTRKNYLPIAKRFLDACCYAEQVDLGALHAPEITAFVQKEAAPRTGGSLKVLTTAVRAFLRFLVFCGAIRPGLEAAVPKLRHWTHAALPQRLTAEQIEQVLATCTGNFPQHLRNQAILLLLARLGLRAHEVATLRLDDIDWRQGHLRLQPGKTHRERLLPLSQEVGHALAQYLQHGRPASASRIVFLNFRAPFRPFSGPSAISRLAKEAIERTGLPNLPRMGAHTFRHSAASHMVNQGASFKEVADVLGHHSLQTTGIYAKLDLDALSSVALPWMGEES